MEKVSIYTLIDPITNFVMYVGQTKGSLITRWYCHISTGRKPRNPVSYWINGLLQKGLKPTIKKLIQVDWELADKVETEFIKHYKSFCALKNISEGVGTTGVAWSDEFRRKLERAGKFRESSERMKAKNPAKLKPVLQYDLQGNLIKEWSSAYAVEKELGIYSAGISRACRNLFKGGISKGFIWKFKMTPNV